MQVYVHGCTHAADGPSQRQPYSLRARTEPADRYSPVWRSGSGDWNPYLRRCDVAHHSISSAWAEWVIPDDVFRRESGLNQPTDRRDDGDRAYRVRRLQFAIKPLWQQLSVVVWERWREALRGTDFANNLYAIDPTTGKATLIGATGVPGVPFVPASTNPDGSFNFYDENLFGADGHLFLNFDAGIFDPATSVTTTVIAAMLYELDPNTGQATKVGSTAFGLVTVSNLYGTVYGFDGVTNQIVTLDVTNGATSFFGDLDPSVGLIQGAAPVGIAPIPEPASIALVLTGVAGLLVHRRKKIV